jgi:hypothetical protein
MLCSDVLGRIALFSGEHSVLQTLRKQICPTLYDSFYRSTKKLIYGEVQSGKTAQIITEIRYSKFPIVLIIQNSRFVQKQYDSRFRAAGISFQLVRNTTTELNARVIILMNNKFQFAKYKSLNPPKVYTILLDESDITQSHPLRANAISEIHVTATPFRYKPNTFDEVQFIDKHPNYYGLDKVTLRPVSEEVGYIGIATEFVASRGILLINSFTRIESMKTVALALSGAHPTVPVILLTTEKRVYMNRVFTPIRAKSINTLLDRYTDAPHVIIVANRMATRGISFTNTARTTHITHQISNTATITAFLQKCRILGVYQDHPNLTLYVAEKFARRVEKYKTAIKDQEAIRERNQKIGTELYKSLLY